MAAEVFEKRRGARGPSLLLEATGLRWLAETRRRRLPRAGASACTCTSWLPCCSTGHISFRISFRMICHIARNVTNHPEGNVHS